MATLTLPTVDEAMRHAGPLFARYDISRGISIVKVNGHFVEKRYPSLLDLNGLTDGTDYFIGGHVYQVSNAIAAALVADGFGAYVDQYGDIYLENYT